MISKATKRFCAVALAGLMLICATACKPSENSGAGGTTADPTALSTAEGQNTGTAADSTTQDVDLGGATVRILYPSGTVCPEFEVSENEGELSRIASAVNRRNASVAARLNVSLEWDSVSGSSSKKAEFLNRVKTQQDAGRGYDIIAAPSHTAAMLSTGGFLADINRVEECSLDFSREWWQRGVIDGCTVGNSLYFVSGDISSSAIELMYGVFYNEKLIGEYDLDDPADLAKTGKWTISSLIDMSAYRYLDVNNGKSDEYDYCGLSMAGFGGDALYYAADLRMVVPDAEKTLAVSPDYTSAKAINLIDRLRGWLNTKDCLVNTSKYSAAFAGSRATFCIGYFNIADASDRCGMNGVDWRYGIVPMPKYDEDQENYVTIMGSQFSLYGIGRDSGKGTAAAAVLECWASEAYRSTTPAIFESSMKTEYSKADVTAQMFDIMRTTMRCDPGRIYSESLGSMGDMPGKAMYMNESWIRLYSRNIHFIRSAVERLAADLA